MHKHYVDPSNMPMAKIDVHLRIMEIHYDDPSFMIDNTDHQIRLKLFDKTFMLINILPDGFQYYKIPTDYNDEYHSDIFNKVESEILSK